MNGTEKQIEWAEAIIAGWQNAVEKEVNEAALRVESGSMPVKWLECVKSASSKVLSSFEDCGEASEIINGRKTSAADIVFKIAENSYNK